MSRKSAANSDLHEIGQVLTVRARISPESRVSFSLHFGLSLDAIPEETRQEIMRTMLQIAEVVSGIPPSSPFWGSMEDSLLQIDVAGYRVVYRADSVHREIVVVELTQIR